MNDKTKNVINISDYKKKKQKEAVRPKRSYLYSGYFWVFLFFLAVMAVFSFNMITQTP